MTDTHAIRQEAQAAALALLAQTPLFADVSASALHNLAAGSTLRNYARDEYLFCAGDQAEYLHVLANGSVQLCASTSDGREAVVELLHPYETFVIATVLTSQRYLRSARAVEPSRLLLIPTHLLLGELKGNPDLAIALLGSMAQKYRHMVREVKSLRLRTASQRLALYLLQLVENSGNSSQAVRLPYEKKILASRLGMTPESFSRALAELRQYNVDVRGDEVRVGDLEQLRAFCRVDQLLDALEQDLKVMLPTTE
jgi:CRP/FNR family transcriptional activator FtrB